MSRSCASNPRPLLPCSCDETRRYRTNLLEMVPCSVLKGSFAIEQLYDFSTQRCCSACDRRRLSHFYDFSTVCSWRVFSAQTNWDSRVLLGFYLV